jgi:hypothetical protein
MFQSFWTIWGRPAMAEALKVDTENPVSAQLEIETYTWDVLPDDLKTGDIVDYVLREHNWVHKVLSNDQSSIHQQS